MYCPSCSTRKSTTNTQFCTKCGLDLNGLSEYIESGEAAGNVGRVNRSDLRMGIKQGLIAVIFGVLMIPIWMFIGAAFPANDRLVESSPSTTWQESVAWVLMWMAFIAGAARIVYAIVFESSSMTEHPGRTGVTPRVSARAPAGLPDAEKFKPADIPMGRWKDSADLATPRFGERRTSGEL